MELNLVMAIVNRDRRDTLEGICQSLKLPMTVSMLCQGTACHVRGAKTILEAVSAHLGVKAGETTPDLNFTIETVACLGACGLAPVMMVNDNTHGRLTPADIPCILDSYLA